MSCPYVYEWTKTRGFFGKRRGGSTSHLLLDGGTLSVPDDSASEFIGAYALGVVKPGRQRPCVVETKTPVFRMFYDLDAHVDVPADVPADVPVDVPVIPDRAFEILAIICDTTAACFDQRPDAVVCVSNRPKRLDGGGAKVGIHVTFDHVFVDSATALAVRDRVLHRLAVESSPFSNDWNQVVDAAVFKGSGMRLPWSAKKNEDDRWYVPVAEYVNGEWARLDNVESSVSAVRAVLSRTSLRYFGRPTGTVAGAVQVTERIDGTSNLTHVSLKSHGNAAKIVETLVASTHGGNVTAVLVGEHAVIFRHESKFCANVGREHRSSNAYFLLTARGLQQCCYSRKNVPDLACQCVDFRGDYMSVPQELMHRFFPPPPPPPMPSSRSTDFDALLTKTRPKTREAKKRTPRVRKPSTMDVLLCKNVV